MCAANFELLAAKLLAALFILGSKLQKNKHIKPYVIKDIALLAD